MASSLCLTLMTLILLLTFVSSTISSRTNRKDHSMGDGDGHENLAHAHIHGSHSFATHMDHMINKDLSAYKIFFTVDDLKLGRKMPLYFPDPSITHFLSREEADSIPFALTKLSNIFQIFSISRGSPEAEALENTLRECESKPVNGEIKFCPTSLESMLDFIRSTLGSSSSSSSSSSVSFNVLSTKVHRSPSQVGVVENYTIVEEPTKIWVSEQVGCHPMAYPYAVFFCHQAKNTKVYKLSLIGELSGEKVDAVAACHMDTSDWNPDLVAFQILGIKPGNGPVCHIFPQGNLLWISSNLIAT